MDELGMIQAGGLEWVILAFLVLDIALIAVKGFQVGTDRPTNGAVDVALHASITATLAALALALGKVT